MCKNIFGRNIYVQRRRPGAEFGRDEIFFLQTKISELRFFPEKISIFTPKISDDFFFSHRPGFSDFPLFTVIKCPIRPFLRKKNHYFKKEFLNETIFLLFILSHASDNTTSLNIGGGMDGPSPTSNFGGTAPQSPSPGLRPCRLQMRIKCHKCNQN